MLYSALSARMAPFSEAREATGADSALLNKIDDLRRRDNIAAHALAAAFDELRRRSTQPRALAKFEALLKSIIARKARTKRAARIRGAVYMPI